jgi:hypothetical protein
MSVIEINEIIPRKTRKSTSLSLKVVDFPNKFLFTLSIIDLLESCFFVGRKESKLLAP